MVKKLKNVKVPIFDAQAFLDSAGLARKVVEYRKSQKIYSQGDPAKTVMYIQKGGVKLSVVNEAGKEAVVAMLGPGDFFGEGCLAGQSIRMGTATAIRSTTLLVIEKNEMIRVLHTEHDILRPIHRLICLHETFESRRIWSTSFSTPARNGWPALFCCSRATGSKTSLKSCSPKYLRRCWRK